MPNNDISSQNAGSGAPGNPDDLIKSGPDTNGGDVTGQPKTDPQPDLSGFVPKDQYEEAQRKIGEQGSELGDYRTFFKEISPILDKLQEHPEIAEAIIEGKFDATLAQAVLDGKVKIEDATAVSRAHEEVKKELGNKNYGKADSADIEKLVAEKVAEMRQQLTEEVKRVSATTEKKLSESEERREFEKSIEGFISNTPDFPEYAEHISKWFETHPDQYDIEIAYHAVKGRILSEISAKDAEKMAAEAAKNLALNAGGGASQGAQIKADSDIVDTLIRSNSNPNIL